jgi:hypothetical protein
LRGLHEGFHIHLRQVHRSPVPNPGPRIVCGQPFELSYLFRGEIEVFVILEQQPECSAGIIFLLFPMTEPSAST